MSQELKRQIGYILCKVAYTCVEMASPKIQTYQNKGKNLVLFILCLTWTVNANSLKQNIVVIKEICCGHLSVNKISSYLSNEGGS